MTDRPAGHKLAGGLSLQRNRGKEGTLQSLGSVLGGADRRPEEKAKSRLEGLQAHAQLAATGFKSLVA